MTNARPTFTAHAARPGSAVSFLGLAICAGALLLMAAGAQAQHLFVVNSNSNSVVVFDNFGNVLPFIAPNNGILRASAAGGMAFDKAGNLYVSGGGFNGAISEFDSGGNLINANIIPFGLRSPAGLAFDRAGNLFVVNAGYGTIMEYTPDGYFFTFASGFTAPQFLAFNSAGVLYVTDQVNHAGILNTYIYELGPYGNITRAFATGFTRLGGLAFDNEGNLYVANRTTLNKSGIRRLVDFSIMVPYGPARLTSLPVGIAFDGAGNLLVAGSGNPGNLMTIDTSQNLTTTFYNELSSPAAMAFQPSFPFFSGFTASQSVTNGATSVSLSGNIMGFGPFLFGYFGGYGPIYPALGESVVVTINGNAQTTTINDSTGDFSFSYDPSTIPGSESPYAITYSYAGDLLLFPATDTSTTLTVLGTSFSGLTASQSIPYGATNVTLSGTVSTNGQVFPANGETVTVTINGNAQTTTINDDTGDFSFSYNPSTIPASTTPYTITYSYAGDDLLYPASDTVTALMVTQATSVLTWTDPLTIIYGAVLTTNELNATASVPGSFVYSPTNGTALDTGTNTLSVIFTPTDTVDYTGATNTASMVVTPALLTVTTTDASRVYGQNSPVFTGAIVGLTNNDTITVAYDCSADSNSAAGNYSIIPSLVDAANRQTNYTVSLIAGTLTVSQAEPQIMWNNPAPMIYGAVLTTNQLSATASVPGSFVYSPTNGTALDTGTNTLSVIFTPTDAADYADATSTLSVVVTPALLTVTAANASRAYGHSNPVFTDAIVGLTNNDNITIAYDCSAASNSAAGTYPIIPTLVDAANRQTNYTVSLIAGTLTVTQAALTVTANDTNRPYGQANPEFTFGISGFVNGEDSTLLTFQPALSTTAIVSSPAGAYPILATGGSDGNYNISASPGSLTVVAALTVSSNAGFYIADNNPILVDTNSAVSDGGGVNFDGATLSISISTNAATNDSLAVQSQGNSDGQIGIHDATVTYGGVAFGTYSGGDGTNALVFTFDTNASSVSVTALMRQATFATTDGSTATRVLTLVLAYDNLTVSAQRLLRINHSPIAGDDAIAAAAGATIYIPFTRLLTNDRDPDDDALTVTITNGLSANGAKLTTDATGVTYSATTNLLTSDSFVYIVDDGHGGQGGATVTITFLPIGKIGVDISDVNGAGAKLTMAGTPGGSYQIMASTDLLTWTVINTVIASPTGIVEILDTGAMNYPTRFYRAIAAPVD